MVCLAYTPDELTPTPKLAAVTQVPGNYLAKVLQLLSSADLITGRRGVGGGYRLTRPSDQISMLDVINAVAEIRRIDSCPLNLPNHTGRLCRLHSTLRDATDSVIDIYSSVTLADLSDPTEDTLPLCDPALTETFRGVPIHGGPGPSY